MRELIERIEHRNEPGWIAERKNPYVKGSKVVTYLAMEQGIDVGGQRYAVVCNAHGTIMGSRSIKDAKIMMRYPDNFCEGCIEIVEKE
jgi:hypothetical protein